MSSLQVGARLPSTTSPPPFYPHPELAAILQRAPRPNPNPGASFPRTNWYGETTIPPQATDLKHLDRRIAVAARNASTAWARDGVQDANGFILAVVDKAYEFVAHERRQRYAQRHLLASVAEWRAEAEALVDKALAMAHYDVASRGRPPTVDDEQVRSFARGAMDACYRVGRDSQEPLPAHDWRPADVSILAGYEGGASELIQPNRGYVAMPPELATAIISSHSDAALAKPPTFQDTRFRTRPRVSDGSDKSCGSGMTQSSIDEQPITPRDEETFPVNYAAKHRVAH